MKIFDYLYINIFRWYYKDGQHDKRVDPNDMTGYGLTKTSWEIYTNKNSNVPSVNIEKIAKDKNGAIWAATYGGIIKLNRPPTSN